MSPLLRERRARLARAVRHARDGALGQSQKESLGELSSCDNHPADLGTETWQRSQGFALLDGMSRHLDEVDAALDRCASGAYGRCERCGRAIPEARLRAIPETRHCVECRRALEAMEARDPEKGPVEEGVLAPPFGRSFTDDAPGDPVGFDGEDAWQAVASFGTSETPADVPGTTYPHIFVDADEVRGGVAGNAEAVDGEGW